MPIVKEGVTEDLCPICLEHCKEGYWVHTEDSDELEMGVSIEKISHLVACPKCTESLMEKSILECPTCRTDLPDKVITFIKRDENGEIVIKTGPPFFFPCIHLETLVQTVREVNEAFPQSLSEP